MTSRKQLVSKRNTHFVSCMYGSYSSHIQLRMQKIVDKKVSISLNATKNFFRIINVNSVCNYYITPYFIVFTFSNVTKWI